MAIELAKLFKADLIVSGVDRSIQDFNRIGINIIETGSILYKYNKTLNYFLEIPLRFFLMKKSFKYDIYIFTGTQTLFAAQKDKVNIWLCHTPNRHVYDYDSMNLNVNLLIRLIIGIYRKIFSALDRKLVERMSKIVSNSRNISKKIRSIYARDSILVYPGIYTQLYKFSNPGDFYLTVARLYPAKRVNIVVNAFLKLEREKLVIVGNGPYAKEIASIISANKNILLYKSLSERRLRKLYSKCKAVIYIPKNEDFGIVPIEANASGKYCITVREGGIREIIRHRENGYFIKPDPVILSKFIKGFKPRKTESKRIQQTAKKFDIVFFREKWKNIVFGREYV